MPKKRVSKPKLDAKQKSTRKCIICGAPVRKEDAHTRLCPNHQPGKEFNTVREQDLVNHEIRRKRKAEGYSEIPMLRGTATHLGMKDRDPQSGKPQRFVAPFRVDKWEERDRLSIVLYDANDTVVAEWWDDDARQMFEDGFFEARKLDASVIQYAREMGWL